MKVKDIIEAFRNEVDDTIQPYLWSDKEVISYLDWAQKDFAETGVLRKTFEITLRATFSKELIGSSGSVTSVKVGSEEILGSPVSFQTDLATTAQLVASQINSYQTKYNAASSGAYIGIFHSSFPVSAFFTTSGGLTVSEDDENFIQEIPSNILNILHIVIGGNAVLNKTSLPPVRNIVGLPRWYRIVSAEHIMLFPRPAFFYPCEIFAEILPDTITHTTPSDTELQIPARYHYDLLLGMKFKAYMKNDTEVGDKSKSGNLLALWQNAKERARRDLIKLTYVDAVNRLPEGLF